MRRILSLVLLISAGPAFADSEWRHNGSIMKLSVRGAERVITYLEPKDSLPVKPGMILFQGKLDGRSYSGSAFVFSSKCGARPFAVTGTVSGDNRLIVLQGRKPKIDRACAVIGDAAEVLRFERVPDGTGTDYIAAEQGDYEDEGPPPPAAGGSGPTTRAASGVDDSKPFPMTLTEIRLLQDVLYKLVYDPERDGTYGDATRAAVAEVQKILSHPSTGLITRAEFNYVLKVDFSGRTWASLAASTDGAYYAVSKRPTRATAHREASEGCRARSQDPDKCTPLDTMDGGWLAAVVCSRNIARLLDSIDYSYVNVALRSTENEAVSRAYSGAMTKGDVSYSRRQCRLLVSMKS